MYQDATVNLLCVQGCARITVQHACIVPSGKLPDEWAGPGALPSVATLLLWNSPLTGNLPASWGRPGAWPSLATLQITNALLKGRQFDSGPKTLQPLQTVGHLLCCCLSSWW